MIDFKEQYSDYRWANKRFEIFKRDNFQCQACKSVNLDLNVHHLYYNNNRDIWDYDNETLITLCKDCHNYIHSLEFKKISNLILLKIIKTNFNYFETL